MYHLAEVVFSRYYYRYRTTQMLAVSSNFSVERSAHLAVLLRSWILLLVLLAMMVVVRSFWIWLLESHVSGWKEWEWTNINKMMSKTAKTTNCSHHVATAARLPEAKLRRDRS